MTYPQPEEQIGAMSENEFTWTRNGFLILPNGTQYTVQREQMCGAQSGGLVYYLLRRRKGELELKEVREINTQRTREKAVRKIAEKLASREIQSMNNPENNPADLNQQNKESMDALSEQQSETPTPRTDESLAIVQSMPHVYDVRKMVPAGLARQLERELAEARREITDLRAQVRELATGEVS